MKKYDLEIMIGWKCNNNCLFCSNRPLRNMCRGYGVKDVTIPEIKKTLDSNKSSAITNIFFVGGEPTILNGFFEILEYTRKKGYEKISIQTNGRMLKNSNFTQKLMKYNVEIGFSIHGDKPEIHDKLTRVKGSFNQLVAAMDNIKSYRKHFRTNSVINMYNYKRLPQIITFLSKYEPNQILFSLVSPVGMTNKNKKKLLPPIRKLKPIIRECADLAKKYRLNIRFSDIPICIINGYENLMIENYFNNDRKIIIKGKADFFYLENKNKNEKEKSLRCKACKKNKVCFGLWKGYTELKKNNGLNAIR